MSAGAPTPTPTPTPAPPTAARPGPEPAASPRGRNRRWIASGVTVVLVGLGLAWEVAATRPVRQAVGVYTALLAAADHEDLETVRRLCSRRYLNAHPPRLAREGGLVGLPRNIHKNFQAWRHGKDVWLCPTNRNGPLYQFVFEDGTWRFDGPIGLLRPRGEVVPYTDLPEAANEERR